MTRVRRPASRRAVAATVATLLLPVAVVTLQATPAAAAVTVDGMLDSSFDTDGVALLTNAEKSMHGRAVAVDAAGRSVAVGTVQVSGKKQGVFVARFTPAGALDATFGQSGVFRAHHLSFDRDVADVVIDSVGRVLVAGTIANQEANGYVIRLTSSGAIDESFGSSGGRWTQTTGVRELNAIAVDSADRVVVAGTTTNNELVVERYLATTGWYDSSFSSDGSLTMGGVTGLGMAIDPQDRVLAVGGGSLARFTAAGALDPSLDSDGIAPVSVTATEVAVTGTSILVAGSEAGSIVARRYTNLGALDATFGAGGVATVTEPEVNLLARSLTTDGDSRVIIGGTARYQSDSGLAAVRLLANGSPDPDFGGYGDGLSVVLDAEWYGYPVTRGVHDVAVDADDRVLVVGTEVDFSNRSLFLARLGTATTPGAPTGASVYSAISGTMGFWWSAPANDGGTPVVYYRATLSPGGLTCYADADLPSCQISGLTNGATYTVTVVAVNGAGEGPSSSPASGQLVAVPGAPTALALQVVTGGTRVSWIAPVDTRGAPITGYTVTESPGGATCATTGDTACTIALPAGRHTYTVRARNVQGHGDISEEVWNEFALPPAAAAARAAVANNRSAAVDWTRGYEPFGALPTTFRVTSTPASVGCTSSGSGCTIVGLTAGTSYSFVVTATNAYGDAVGVSTNAVAVPPDVVPPPIFVPPFVPRTVVTPPVLRVPPAPRPALPGTPTLVTGVRGNRQVVVSWAESTPGSSPVTGYTVFASPGGATCASATISCVVSGLVNGVGYTFTARAANAVGVSPASEPSARVVPATTPGASPRVVGVRGHLSAVVTWAAPANGGSAVTGYRVVASPGGRACTTTGALRCTVTGLVNGRAYRFAVSATNAVGVGSPSVASAAVTPAPVPGVPTRVIAARGNGRVTVSFTAPVANGTAPITGYRVVASPGGASCSATGVLRCTISGLVNGRSYAFSVVAINRVGASPASAAVSATPATVPTPVRGLVATFPAASRTVLTWLPPASIGGLPLTRYEYRSSSDNGRTWTRWVSVGLARSAQLTGWARGRTYLVDVMARTAAGASVPVRLVVRPTR